MHILNSLYKVRHHMMMMMMMTISTKQQSKQINFEGGKHPKSVFKPLRLRSEEAGTGSDRTP